MSFLQLTFFCCLLNFFAGDQASEYSSLSETKIVEPAKDAGATNILLQSKDGGQTWQDISSSLPETEQPEVFFAGPSEIYFRINGVLYRSESNLKTPVWEKANVPDQLTATIAFNQSGVMAYSYDGKIYKKSTSSETWLPIYTNLISHEVATIFEVSDGTILRSTGKNFFKSSDKAQSWKLSQKGWVGKVVESDGVLLASGVMGIMRSTDKGESWEWVISEGGVGIDVERIDGGFAAISYNTQSKSRRIRTSFDGGKTWKAIDEGLQPSPNISSVKQLGSNLFIGHPDGIFSSSDMGKTWHRVLKGFGNGLYAAKVVSLNPAAVPEKVFKVYVSGNVLYAVGVTTGC